MNYFENIEQLTVYQLVQYVNRTYGTRIQHNQVMSRQMPGLLNTEGFGLAQQIVEHRGNNNHWHEITTYSLTPRQCVVVAAKICNPYLVHIVDRLDYLERKHNEPNTQDTLSQEIAGLRKMVTNPALTEFVNEEGFSAYELHQLSLRKYRQ